MAHRKALLGLLQSFRLSETVSGPYVRRMSVLGVNKDPREKDVIASKGNVLQDQKPAKKEAGTSKAKTLKEFKIYRWNPDNIEKPYLKSYFVDISQCGPMVSIIEYLHWSCLFLLLILTRLQDAIMFYNLSFCCNHNAAGIGCADENKERDGHYAGVQAELPRRDLWVMFYEHRWN